MDDPPPKVVFQTQAFSFTGTFHPSPKKDTDYLVIGTVASRD